MLQKQQFDRITNAEYLFSLSSLEFEYFTKFFLEELGFKKVRVTPKYEKFDLAAEKDGEKYYVECKLWHRNGSGKKNIPKKPVELLAFRMQEDGIKKGLFFCPLYSYHQIETYAAKYGIEIFGIEKIQRVLDKINKAKNKKPLFSKFVPYQKKTHLHSSNTKTLKEKVLSEIFNFLWPLAFPLFMLVVAFVLLKIL
jgi:hypothetical protein